MTDQRSMLPEGFLQSPPQPGNMFASDQALRAALGRMLPADVLASHMGRWLEMGDASDTLLRPLGEQAEANPPKLRAYDAWGRRIDRVEVCDAWNTLLKIAAEWGLIAAAYERKEAEYSRVVQAVNIQIFGPWSAVATCPLAMTDGCARIMETWGRDMAVAPNAFKRLTSRDPAAAWTAGQWMTEKEGGSDVGRTSTRAQLLDGQWRLSGTKYFTSATTSQCTLTLARPEGAGPGSGPLQMFYLEPWRADGSPNAMMVRRLKEKLGTKALPTAELELLGSVAHLVGDPAESGIRKITTVLNICRYWNTLSATYMMRHACALAFDYASRREAFNKTLSKHPLHLETLAGMQTEYEGALAISLRLAHLLGKTEVNTASATEAATLRLLTPLAKLMTGKQAVAVTSEALEAFGGAGYMEDTGLPRLLRDAQVLPIWEGTTNVLSLDALRAMARDDAFPCLMDDLNRHVGAASHIQALSPSVAAVQTSSARLTKHAHAMASASPEQQQLTARGFAMSLARTYTGALLLENAARDLTNNPSNNRAAHVAARWCERGLCDLYAAQDPERAAHNHALLGF